LDQLKLAAHLLTPLEPDFISVTYGANGSSRERTIEATEHLVDQTDFRVMGHLTCASQSTGDLTQVLQRYAAVGVNHVLAVRGDMPGGPTAPWQAHPDGLANATELVKLIKQTGDFCVGVAAFPDPHPQTKDPDLDARILLDKQQAGAEFAITQLFFSADTYFSMVDRVRQIGCTLPIIPGIMPITRITQVERFADLSGAAIPQPIIDRLEAHGDDPAAVREIGLDIASAMSQELIDGGAPGLHFFTQNRSAATRAIYAGLSLAGG
jgi:methylenetetrahydrofolate reductase (NADPH)